MRWHFVMIEPIVKNQNTKKKHFCVPIGFFKSVIPTDIIETETAAEPVKMSEKVSGEGSAEGSEDGDAGDAGDAGEGEDAAGKK